MLTAQADKEALELRRQLLTRLLREAKGSWVRLRPREAALRRALAAHGAVAAPAGAPAAPVEAPQPPAPLPQLAQAVPGASLRALRCPTTASVLSSILQGISIHGSLAGVGSSTEHYIC